MEFREASTNIRLYPIVISQSRYGGVYEGGTWFCIPNCESIPEDAVGDDCDCADFWMSEKSNLIGVGATPDLALMSMLKKNGVEYSNDEPEYSNDEPGYVDIWMPFYSPSKEEGFRGSVPAPPLTDTEIERTDYFSRASGFTPKDI